MSIVPWIGVVFIPTFNSVFVCTTPGRQFVASCPWVIAGNTMCRAHIYTTERVVRVNITLRLNIAIFASYYYFVKRDHSVEYPLSDNKAMGEHDSHRPIAQYPVYVFKAFKQFSVVIVTRRKVVPTEGDALLLTPIHMCYDSYYTVTAKQHPFFTIFSFDYSTTIVTITCPPSKTQNPAAKLGNSETAPCVSGEYHLYMYRYQAWYYTLNDTDASLLNVLIQSDFPVYVISGNTHLAWENSKDGTTRDIATTSIKPSTTWGKEYIVPSLGNGTRMFSVHAVNFPLSIMFKNNKKSRRTEHLFHESKVYTYGNCDSTLFVSADVPFALYQIFSSTLLTDQDPTGLSILNLFPTEQWKHGGYVYLNFFLQRKSYKLKFYLITWAPQENVHAYCSEKHGIPIKWRDTKISKNGTTYSVADGEVDCAATFYADRAHGTMIIYVIKQSLTLNISLYSYACDHHQGEIYQTSCKVFKNFSPSDGVDNDCDGYVDEEIENGVDDDGDGLIDEDFVQAHSNGSWSQWSYVCDEHVFDKILEVRVRSCLNRSLYGKDCAGESVECNGEPCNDPTTMFHSYVKKSCYCNAGCETCDRTMFECQGCRQGYKNTEHCLTRCPLGWIGYDCKDKAVKDNEHLTILFKITLLVSLLFTFITFIVVCMFIRIAITSE